MKKELSMEKTFDQKQMKIRIKYLKKERRLTNVQLSKESGIPLGTLNNFLGAAIKEPKIDTVIKLANALNVSTDYLIFGETIGLSHEAIEIAQRYEAADKHIQNIVQTALNYHITLESVGSNENDSFKERFDVGAKGAVKSSTLQKEQGA
jgi:transcriptional regulator with XRE-family HTH domain